MTYQADPERRKTLYLLDVTKPAAVLMGLPWHMGALAAASAMAGDCLSSFIKRRFGLEPSSMTLGLDQVPELLFPAVACSAYLPLGPLDERYPKNDRNGWRSEEDHRSDGANRCDSSQRHRSTSEWAVIKGLSSSGMPRCFGTLFDATSQADLDRVVSIEFSEPQQPNCKVLT